MPNFINRTEAGKLLAKKLTAYFKYPDAIVLALPRGGVPVAYEVSQALQLPLDVFLVRKLGMPGQEELAIGAIAMGGVRVLNDSIIRSFAIDQATIDDIAAEQEQELERRNELYRHGQTAPILTQRTVILIDDGIATGATMKAAIKAIRHQHPAKLIVATPVMPADTYVEFKQLVDELICLEIPEPFYSVGMHYEEFPQTSDAEVCTLLASTK